MFFDKKPKKNICLNWKWLNTFLFTLYTAEEREDKTTKKTFDRVVLSTPFMYARSAIPVSQIITATILNKKKNN